MFSIPELTVAGERTGTRGIGVEVVENGGNKVEDFEKPGIAVSGDPG